MGGVLDFLFGGNAPANAPATGGTRNVPQFMSDAGLNIAGKVNAVANDPWTPYQGPRIASPTQDQQSGWQMARDTAGAYQPAVNGALTQAGGVMGQVDPIYNSAQTGIQGGMGRFTGQTVNDYMNPYTQNVINAGTNNAMENYNENVLPGLRSEFIGSGQYGSLGHEAQAGFAARNLTKDLQLQDQAALAQSYDAGRGAFQNDQNRQITGGQALGNLGQSYGQLADQNAQMQGELAAQGQGMGLKGAAAMDAAGQEQGAYTQKSLDTAYQDFLNQRDWQKNQLGWETGTLAGMPQQSSSANYTQPASSYGPSPLQSAAQIYATYKGATAPQARGGLIHKYATGGLAQVAGLTPDQIGGGGSSNDVPDWLKTVLAALMAKQGQQPAAHNQSQTDIIMPQSAGPASQGSSGGGGLSDILGNIGGGKGGGDNLSQILDLFKGSGSTGRNVEMEMGQGAPEWLPDTGSMAQVPGSTSLWTAPTAESLGTAGAPAADAASAAWAAPSAESLGAPASSFTMPGAVPSAATPSAAGSGLGATLGGVGAAVGLAVLGKHMQDNTAGLGYNDSRQLASFLADNAKQPDPTYGRGKYSDVALSAPPPGFKSWSQYFAATQLVQDSMHASGGAKDQGTYSMLLDEQGLPTDRGFYEKVYPGQDVAYRTIIGPNGLGTSSNSRGGRARGGLARLRVE